MNYSNHWGNKIVNQKGIQNKHSPVSSAITKKSISKHSSHTIQYLYKKHQLKMLVAQGKLIRGSMEEYQSIKVKGAVIKIGETAVINSGTHHSEDYIGTIKQILSIREPTTQKLICICKVEWFLRKSEIKKQQNWISDQELFRTGNSDYILAQTIIEPCRVLTINEYLNLDEVDSALYFSRLEWDLEKQKFRNFEGLQQFCSCHQPVNPDRKYIQCDQCQEWYHFECAGIKNETVDGKDFCCIYCQ